MKRGSLRVSMFQRSINVEKKRLPLLTVFLIDSWYLQTSSVLSLRIYRLQLLNALASFHGFLYIPPYPAVIFLLSQSLFWNKLP